jgi:mRNA-degrading endonuclease RelE of RelBE toxin-antitoxin system
MKVPKLPNNIKIHPTVWRSIKEISILDDKTAGKIIQRITALGIDPVPNNDECTSKVVQNLKKYRLGVRRLRCIDIADYRVFYAVRENGMVCVYAVIYAKGDKHDLAYHDESSHYSTIKLLSKYWKEC